MKFLYLMDPLQTVVMQKDTTFAFMLEAYQRKHEIYYLAKNGITAINGKYRFHVQKVKPQRLQEKPFEIESNVTLDEIDVDAIFIRTDPPFDYDYLMKTWSLDALKDRVFIINDPAGIRTVNEKIWTTQLLDLIPPTCVTRNKNEYLGFLNEYAHIVAKPTDGFGGKGVFQIQQKDPNINVIFETLTNDGSRDVILQKYIPEAQNGDKRILLLNGEILGAVLRLHGDDDPRNNFFAGGKAVKTTLTERDHRIVTRLKPDLQKLGLYFVGIDIMGDYLIEVNVTSPTCLQEINYLENKQLESDVITFVEKQVALLKVKHKITF